MAEFYIRIQVIPNKDNNTLGIIEENSAWIRVSPDFKNSDTIISYIKDCVKNVDLYKNFIERLPDVVESDPRLEIDFSKFDSHKALKKRINNFDKDTYFTKEEIWAVYEALDYLLTRNVPTLYKDMHAGHIEIGTLMKFDIITGFHLNADGMLCKLDWTTWGHRVLNVLFDKDRCFPLNYNNGFNRDPLFIMPF